MTVGEKIKARRKELGFTLEALARKVHVASKSTVQKWESGYIKKISYRDIKLLAEALEVPVSYFDEGVIMTTGEKIRERRKELGLSAYDIAKRLNIAPSTYYKWESGETDKIPYSSIEMLAGILKMSLASQNNELKVSVRRVWRAKVHRVKGKALSIDKEVQL